jgi:PAS domain S-box-containing protein
MFELVTRALNVAYYEWFPASDELRVSKALMDLFGHDPKTWNTQRFFELVHPNDVMGYRASLTAFLKSKEERSQCAYRFRSFSGQYRWLIDHRLAQRDATGRVARLVGAVSDITEAKWREEENRALIARQTASIEVLKTISASPDDPQPVFDLIARSAIQLCPSAQRCSVTEHADGMAYVRSTRGHDTAQVEVIRQEWPRPIGGDTVHGRVALTGGIVLIRDVEHDRTTEGHSLDLAHALAYRSMLGVPLRHEGQTIGSIVVASSEHDVFGEGHVALLESFAEQAVIAITSARARRELAARNSQYRERIAQQAATIDVLKSMSASPGDAQPVFELITEHARAFCEGEFAALVLRDEEVMRVGAWIGPSERRTAWIAKFPWPVDESTTLGRAILTQGTVSIADTQADPGYAFSEFTSWLRSTVAVALVRDGEAIGAIGVGRTTPGPFSMAQEELLRVFAEQAVIAIRSAETYRALQQRTRDLAESLEQQTATAEVLQVINSSPGDLAPIFEAILDKALKLCAAACGVLWTYDGEQLHAAAVHGASPAFAEFLTRAPHPIGPDNAHGRLLRGEPVVHIPDIILDGAYKTGDSLRRGLVQLGGGRSLLAVPLRRDDAFLGDFAIYRTDARPFTDEQIALLQSFAAQAVIAMENARLLTEQREALEQQTATAEVLKVISRSAFDLQAVLETLIESAARLCNAPEGLIYLREGDVLSVRAVTGVSNTLLKFIRENPHRLGSKSVAGRVLTTGAVVNVADIALDPDYDYPGIFEHEGGRFPSLVGAPLLRDGRVEGVMTLSRPQALPFPPRQVELLATFADQAVIAVENARLFDAVQRRTQELAQSVAELQALEEVLRAVNSSLDLDTVLSTIISRAVPLAQADEGMIYEFDDAEEVFLPKAAYGMSDDRIAWLRDRRIRIGETFLGRSATERRPIHIADVQQDPSTPEAPEILPGIHAVLAIPLLREDKVIGGLVIRRRSEGAFDETTVKLLQTFATQSVLAIANARLFDEVQARTKELTESLEIQSATADVLKAISRSAFELDTVLETLTRSAANLCDAATGIMHIREGENFRMGAMFGHNPGMVEYRKGSPLRPGRGSIAARAALTHQVEHILDIQADPEIEPDVKALTSNRTALAVPLLRQDMLEGVFVLGRRRVDAFSQRQTELVQTFADQALIAIENARLFNEVQARTQELAKLLDDLRSAQDRLIQTEKLASLGQLTAGIAHEIKNPLNFVNNFSSLSVDLIDELHTALTPVPIDAAVRAEVKEVTDLLRGNLEKVVQHGKRADGIVKNMLLHARESRGERRSIDLNAIVDEALNLAYHGARAEKPGFTITLERNFDPAVGSVELYPQEFTRVMLNLISNGFYAATRKARDAAGPDFQPTLTVRTEAQPDAVVIRVRDNGTGIPDSARARLFEPFFTTKPAGEGTGLGLSLSHDIIVKQHGGSIAVDSRVGEYTVFTITLPRTNAEAPS